MNEDTGVEDFAPWLVLLIVLAGAGLRVLQLDMKGLWLDETFSVWLAGHSMTELLQWIVKIDQHPPLYYILLHYWMALNGSSPYTVRLLSVLFGVGTVPIIYLIGKRMSGPVVGLASAAMMAFSLFHIYYAQEARMYTLLTFNAAAATYALVRLLTDARSTRPIGSQFGDYVRAWRTSAPVEPEPTGRFSYRDQAGDQTGWRGWISRHRWLPIQDLETDLAWLGLIVFSAATLYSHNTAVLFLLAANVFVLGLMLYQRVHRSGAQPAFQAPSLGNWIKAQGTILLLWSPWILPFLKQAGSVYRRFWVPAPTWNEVVGLIRSFLVTSAPIPGGLANGVWIFYGLVLVLGLISFRKKWSQFFFLAALFAVPFLGELIVSIWRPVFLGRTLIWTTIPLFLLLASGAAQLRFRILILLAVGSFCTLNVFSTGDYLRFYQKEDWNAAARSIAGYTEKDDLILFNSNFVEIAFNYYFKPYEDYYDIQVVKRGVPLDLFESGVLEPEMTAQDVPGLIDLLKGHERVWLVYSHDLYTDPTGLIPKTLASQMKLAQKDDFYGGAVYLYVKP
jgi:hypothetical protein